MNIHTKFGSAGLKSTAAKFAWGKEQKNKCCPYHFILQ